MPEGNVLDELYKELLSSSPADVAKPMEAIYREFVSIAGASYTGGPAGVGDLAGVLGEAAPSISESQQQQAAILAHAGDVASGAVPGATLAPASSGPGAGMDLLGALAPPIAGLVEGLENGPKAAGLAVLGGLLQSSPIGWIGDALGWFNGGSAAAELPPLVKYAMPESVNFAGALEAGGAVDSVSYDQSGFARPDLPDASGSSAGSGGSPVSPAPALAPTGSNASAAVLSGTAVDPRVWTDNAPAIAAAVREQLLYSHPLGDVINDLS